jgi:hypothetical protein
MLSYRPSDKKYLHGQATLNVMFMLSVKMVKKANQSRYTPWWRLGGEEVQLLLILDLGTRWG